MYRIGRELASSYLVASFGLEGGVGPFRYSVFQLISVANRITSDFPQTLVGLAL